MLVHLRNHYGYLASLKVDDRYSMPTKPPDNDSDKTLATCDDDFQYKLEHAD